MHWDHAGNYDLFPNARYHIQDTEMAYATGRCMCHQMLRIPFSVSDVLAMVRKVFAYRVEFHDGVDELAPGITVHKIGGHSKGLQCVRVKTRRGYVVVASDSAHLYSHIDEGRVFPITYSVGDTLEGYKTLPEARLLATPHCSGSRSRGPEALSGGEAGIGKLDRAAGCRAEGVTIAPKSAGRCTSNVMAGLVPAIQVFVFRCALKTWMPGTRPGMTFNERMAA
jgi:hypothetical protein